MCLAQVILPAMTRPSLIAILVAAGVWNCVIRCAPHWPGVHLCRGSIHLVVSCMPSPRLESHLMWQFSASASGLCDMGMYSIMTDVACSFRTDVPLNPLVNAALLLLTHCAVSTLSSS